MPVSEKVIIPSEEALRNSSSNASVLHMRGALLNTVPNKLQKTLDLYNEPEDSKILRSWVDALNPNMNLKFQVGDYRMVTYKRSYPLTTMSNEWYSTTSLWWLILRVNGIMHPDELEEGVTLKIPTLEAIKRTLNPTIKVSKKGKVVTV
jgi:hypothetical protein